MHDGRRRLAGRYELGAIVGRGGMGTVHRARDLVLDRTVAVKLLPAALAEQDPSHVARFEREARAAASLTHEGVVAIYDTGEDDATRFIVMEFVDGRSLADVLREDAPLEAGRAADMVARVAAALAAAHAAGIVHRDVKPANVMVADDGAVKVLDFGIARSVDGSTLTQNASLLGTAGYMAPEQALGERADERSDVYSLGCLLYALLTGSPPFTGESAAAVLHQHVNSEPRAPGSLNRSVSPALDAAVLAMLAKSPDRRPQSAADAHRRLQDAAATGGRTAQVAPRRASAPTRRLEPTASTRVLSAGSGRRGRRRAAAGAALAAGAVLIIAIVALASGGGSHRRAGSPPRATRSTGTLAAASSPKTAKAPQATSSAPAGAPSAQGPPPSVAASAAALSALLAQLAQAGSIDPQAARQLTGGVAEVLAAQEAGHPLDAQRHVLDLSKHLAQLQERGRISPAAAGSLGSSLATLTGLVGTAAQASQPQSAESTQEDGSPIAAGERPGKSSKHGDRHGHGEGD